MRNLAHELGVEAMSLYYHVANKEELLNHWGNRMQRHNAAAIITRLARQVGVTRRITPHALRRSYITIGLLQGVALREMQRAARHTKADTTVAYDQSERSFHRDPTFVLMTATAR